MARLPSIQDLVFGGDNLANDTLVNLRPLSDQLNELYLAGSRVTDEGVAALTSFTNLKKISFRQTEVGEEAVRQLAKIPSLEHVNLSSGPIRDKAFEHLAVLPNLRHLEIPAVPVTAERFEAFRNQYPKCQLEGSVRQPRIND